MYRKIKEHLLSIKEGWEVVGDKLYFSKESILYKQSIDSNYPEQEIDMGDTIFKILYYRQQIIVFFSSTAKRVQCSDLRIIDDVSFESRKFIQQYPFNNKLFGKTGDGINTRRRTFLYDFALRADLWITDSRVNPTVFDGYGVSNLFDKVERFELETGQILWSQSVLDIGRYFQGKLRIGRKVFEGEVDRFLGLYNEVLWVLLKNGMLLGLKIETGEILYKVGAPKQYPAELSMMEETKELNYYYNHQSIFDSKQGKIIRLWHAGYSDANYDWYFEVDLNAAPPELTINKVDNVTEQSFSIDGNPCPLWPFDDGYIYVCNYRDYKLALFNRKTKEIDWVHQIEVDPAKKSFIIEMQVQDDRWYILDNLKTLYVYGREN